MASTWDSIAVGAGWGAVKGWTVTSGGRVGWTVVRQLLVIEGVALGLMSRMLIIVRMFWWGFSVVWWLVSGVWIGEESQSRLSDRSTSICCWVSEWSWGIDCRVLVSTDYWDGRQYVRCDLHEGRLGLTEFECGLEMVIACIYTYSRGTSSRLPRLSDHIVRRELAGEALPAAIKQIKQIVAPVPVRRFLCALPMQGCR